MIDVSVVGSWGAVELVGDYDLANSDEIRCVAEHLIGQGVTDLAVDLSRVTFMDVAGLDALLAVGRLCEAAAGGW